MFGFEKRKDSRSGDQPFAVDRCTMVKRIRTAATDSFRPISWQTALHRMRECQDNEERDMHKNFKRHSEGLKFWKCLLLCP